jgi:hypothetical protein
MKYDSIVFDSKPEAVPYNYRLSYKIGQICLIMSSQRKGGTSLQKINMISIAMLSEEEKFKLLTFCDGNDPFFVIRFDPSINRTIIFALCDGLICQQNNGFFKLTEKGKMLADSVLNDKTVFFREKLFIEKISQILTESKICELRSKWGEEDAEN